MLAPTINEGEEDLTRTDEFAFPFGQSHRYSTNGSCDEAMSAANDDVRDISFRLQHLHERRCQMVRRWTVGDDPRGSTGSHVGEPPPGDERRPQDGHCPVPVTSSMWCAQNNSTPGHRTSHGPDVTVGGKMCASPTPTQRMNDSMMKLRRELASLFSQDHTIFEHLLLLRQSIAQLKQQSYDDLYEDAEVTYLSSNGGSFRFRRDGSKRQGSTEAYSCFSPLEQNCEDSGISLVSSGLSSPSMSPSPTATTVAALQLPAPRGTVGSPVPGFPSNNVTFPPSRNRQSRCGASADLAKSKRSSVSTPSGVDTIGNCILSEFTKPLTSSRSRQSFAEAPPVLLVRSRSITFLPRGVLVRRETLDQSGVSSQPVDGEVFV